MVGKKKSKPKSEPDFEVRLIPSNAPDAKERILQALLILQRISDRIESEKHEKGSAKETDESSSS